MLPAPLNRLESPAFRHRFLSLNPSRDNQIWLRRQKVGSSLELTQGHAWYRIVPEDRYYEDHPEYFALVNGVRGTRGGRLGHEHQLCTSNPEVRQLFVDEAVRFFEANPKMKAFSIAPNDGNGHCECDRCRALDVETLPSGQPLLTDRLFDFYNAVARGVALRAPGRVLTTYAYQQAAPASPRLSIEANLYVLDVYNFTSTLLRQPGWKDYVYQNTALWRRLTPNTVFTSYIYLDAFALWSLPQASSRVLPELLRALKDLNTPGVFLGLAGSTASYGHDAWLLAHLLWNPAQSETALLDDYYSGTFGASAGPLLRQFHGLLEDASSDLAATLPPDAPALTLSRALDSLRPQRARLRQLINEAQASPASVSQRIRIDAIARNFTYVERSMDGVRALQEALDATRAPLEVRLEKALMARAAVESRNELLADDSGPSAAYDLNRRVIGTQDLQRCTAFVPTRLDALEAMQPYEAHAAFVRHPPRARDWNRAPALGPFRNPCLTTPVPVQTDARLLYTRQALYLRLEAPEPDADVLSYDLLTERDAPVWTENALEVFLRPDLSAARYVHFMTNGIGTQFDEWKGDSRGTAWNGRWKARVERFPDRTVTILEIPFSDLDLPSPRGGETVGFNLTRTRHATPPEASAWSPTFGGFHAPVHFGTLTFLPPR
jgi:hypothetical protein